MPHLCANHAGRLELSGDFLLRPRGACPVVVILSPTSAHNFRRIK
jgi:hypothetical protein